LRGAAVRTLDGPPRPRRAARVSTAAAPPPIRVTARLQMRNSLAKCRYVMVE